MLDIQHISKRIAFKSILEDIHFTLQTGRSLAVVGESGSGKSTLARIIMGLERPTSGRILFNGVPAPERKTAEFKSWYQQIQFVFQNTAASLDPRMTIFQSIEEPLCHLTKLRKNDRKVLVHEYAAKVGLPQPLLSSVPSHLSGGQYQRACIAKALIVRPKLLVCDEIVSNLDVIHQHTIIELLQSLQAEQQLSLLFITHDLSLVPSLCEDVLVMKDGRMVELIQSALLNSSQHPYTASLLGAVKLLGQHWHH
ncbi:dipeptide/oligopeptide/nickel ABC transporter ATP-binding protein [Paenibacillus sp. WQ 127069]|uniref:Dipeptide/oligopeptide/nickel ABC transporter ATP-binding protein n=1 Tax=Paenibacillus baimaensis TaxID=2982185 RepID=A0ABT2U975_9BACL|nr:dipeptide/oligopeptide/nickel ABC transporter ATP-binding protein [Paenibacillus sp. WQ 127069]MCU6791188.1 dipeptide/oligopeptide/nickel ABC transporter ATP-binding protein [Paenibacillus sp. WQ 127069]